MEAMMMLSWKSLAAGVMAAVMLAGPVMAQPRGWDDRREWRDDRRDWKREVRRDERDWRRAQRDWYRDQRYWRPVGRDEWRWAGPRHRGPGYAWPPGFAYRPWGVGYRLPPVFLGQPYWVPNPAFYRLPPAWGGGRWVRYGPDALMVQANGVVIQVVRGVWF
jgi:hypothetical protein